MKLLGSFIFATFILLGVFFTTTSCAKKPAPQPVPSTVSATPTYTFSAFSITATGVQYTIFNPTNGPLQITGSNGNGTNSSDQKVVITINSAVNSMGSYSLSASNNNSGVYSSGANTMSYSTGSSPYVGTLNITKYDATNHVMSVTFNFQVKETQPTTSGQGTIYGSFDNIGF